MNFAIIKTGGKQYIVTPGQKLKVEILRQAQGKELAKEGEEVTFDQVLLTSDVNKLLIGTPLVEGAKVTAKVLSQGKAKKVTTLKSKPKKRTKVKRGHRQPYTEVQIN